MELKELNIKNFISDIPNIVNANFKQIKDTIVSFFDSSTGKITANSCEIAGNLKSNSIKTEFITVNNQVLDINDILNQLNDLQNRVHALENN